MDEKDARTNLLSMGKEAWDDSILVDLFEQEARFYDKQHSSFPTSYPKLPSQIPPHTHGVTDTPSEAAYEDVPHPHNPPPMPLPAGDDEELANLLMSWYYAGYYTALYKSKRQ